MIKSSRKSKDLKISLNKFLSNSIIAPKKMNTNWSWHNQKEWHGTCKSKFMQSPQNIAKNNVNLEQISSLKITASDLSAQLKEKGILSSALGPKYLRLVTHLDLTDSDIETVNQVLPQLLQRALVL